MSKIGLIDVDSHNYPNLCLMKLSAYHKQMGDQVEWYDFCEHYDLVYISKVFSDAYTPDYNYVINADKVVRGGTGYCIDLVDGREVFHQERNTPLPDEVEHIMPDYSLYPQYVNTAYGFLTRGCPRGCSFCIVGKKEGLRSVKVADLSEFWAGQKKIVLNDPNILACKDWKDLLWQLADSKALVDFNQGMDICLMTEEKIEAINKLKMKEIHFAWDNYEDRDRILPKLKMFAEMSPIVKKRSHNAIVYILTNFNTTIEQDLDRIYTLRNMGYWAYVMIYNKHIASKEIKRIQSWTNNKNWFMACDNYDKFKVMPNMGGGRISSRFSQVVQQPICICEM